jgi:hypothetical protein
MLAALALAALALAAALMAAALMAIALLAAALLATAPRLRHVRHGGPWRRRALRAGCGRSAAGSARPAGHAGPWPAGTRSLRHGAWRRRGTSGGRASGRVTTS